MLSNQRGNARPGITAASARLRIVDLYLIVKWVLAGVYIRRAHDLRRHRQAR